MSVELAGITLNRIHKVATLERADFVSHRVPGLEGNLVQNMGRESVVLQIEGIFYGPNAKDDLEGLRNAYKGREPVDFLADIVGQAYFSQVVLSRFEVFQRASEPEQFSYTLTIAEYVPPPEPESGLGLDIPGVDALINLEALDFIDMIQLPDLFSLPEISNPTEPLSAVVDGLGNALGGLNQPADMLGQLFGGSPNGNRDVRAPGQPTSVFSTIEANVSPDQLLSSIGSMVARFTGAAGDLDGIFANAGPGIGNMGTFLSQLSRPDFDRSADLTRGFDGIADSLNIDTTGLTGAMTGALEQFFGDLSANLTGRIAGLVAAFEAIKALTEIRLDEEPPAAEPNQGNAMVSRILRAPGEPSPIEAGIADLRSQLDRLPNPLTVHTLLEWMLHGLQQLPRRQYPLRYVPIVDELRDKLETVTTWFGMDAPALSKHMAESLAVLQRSIQRSFYTEGAGALSDRLQNVVLQIDAANFSDSLEQVKARLNKLAAQINDGSLDSDELASLIAARRRMDIQIDRIRISLNAGQERQLITDLRHFGADMNGRMFQLIADLNPPADLPALALLIAPFNQLLDQVGFNSLIKQIRATFTGITGLLDQLNISGIKDTLEGFVNDASGGIDQLRQMLIEATVGLTMVMNTIENAIAALQIEQIIAAMQRALEEATRLVEGGITSLFEPVRDLLNGAFTTLNNLLDQFNPRTLIESLRELLQTLTNVLSDPQLLNTVDALRQSLDSVNTELSRFSFRPIADVVVQAIGVVEDALNIALSLPLPDSLRQELENALGMLPESLDSTVEDLNTQLHTIIENSAVPALETIRDKPAELVAVVAGFSPAHFIGDNLTRPYREFLETLANYRPGILLQPVEHALTEARQTVQQQVNLAEWVRPLQQQYDRLPALFDQIDPQALIAPLQEQLSAGIHAVTDNLPLDQTNTIFDTISDVTALIRKKLDQGFAVNDLLRDVHNRIAGLSDAETQMRQYGADIVAKLDNLQDINAFTTGLSQVATALETLRAAPLQQTVITPLDRLLEQLNDLQARPKLSAVVTAYRAFPFTALDNLPDSNEKSALQAFFNDFPDPMDEAIAQPIQQLENLRVNLATVRTDWPAVFADWDERFHGSNSPLHELRIATPDLPAVKALLTELLRRELTEALAPLFRAIDYISSFFAALIQEITTLLDEVQARLDDLLDAAAALEGLRDSINSLVEALENFDISFLADEIQDIFDAVENQLQAVNPARLVSIVQKSLDDLLAIFNLEKLLHVSALDDQFGQIIETLHQNDPGRLLAEVVQPEYDKIPAFLQRFDLQVPINTFIERIRALQLELHTELNRTSDAYEGMLQVVPADLQASIGVRVST